MATSGHETSVFHDVKRTMTFVRAGLLKIYTRLWLNALLAHYGSALENGAVSGFSGRREGSVATSWLNVGLGAGSVG